MFLKSSTALFVCLFVCCVCLFFVFTHFHSTGEENRYIFVAHHHDLKSSCCLFQEKFQNYKSNKIQALKVGVQYVVTKARKRSHCPNTRKQNISKVQIRKTKQCWHWRLWKRKIGLVRCGNQSKSRESLSYHKKTKHEVQTRKTKKCGPEGGSLVRKMWSAELIKQETKTRKTVENYKTKAIQTL